MNDIATRTRTVWLIRHGMREDFVDPNWWDHAKRPHDPPLSSQGLQMARETGEFLSDYPIDVIYTSPFLRTVETAGTIASVLNCPVRIEHGLTETLKSAWFPAPPEYLTAAELHVRFPHIDVQYATKVLPVFPEDDEAVDTGGRCARMADAVLEDDWVHAIWVGHGASVGASVRALVGQADGVCCYMCGVNRVEWIDGRWMLTHAGNEHLSWTEEEHRFH